MIYKSTWWSVELPPHWHGNPDADCTTFRAGHASFGGVLQISAAYKDTGIVTDQDLKEFAQDRLVAGAPFDCVRFGSAPASPPDIERTGSLGRSGG